MQPKQYPEENIAKIVHLIAGKIHPRRIIWFGSRAQGKTQPYADYDIAFEGVEMTHRTERHLKDLLDQQLGIFSVDLVNLDKADPQFKEIVEQTGKIVYEI
ncbi:MAG TPA: nucleotidyltransferase domain-containing protein [Chloroflexi bacterium]|nr:nucleotidyltransferase domain-containing protein [Chloroflexota bacterium]